MVYNNSYLAILMSNAMKLESIDIYKSIDKVKKMLLTEKTISPAFKVTIEMLLLIVELLIKKLNLNSRNSSKPPSTDQNEKKENNKKSKNRPGGQSGHKGTTLKPIERPDKIEYLKIDRNTLPKGGTYNSDKYVARQVVEIKISRIVIEYRAEKLIDQNGNIFTAAFPDNISRPIQYGSTIKSHSVYLSIYQLIPYDRVKEQFNNEYNIPLSTGTVFNFNQEASKLLLNFEKVVKHELIKSNVAHADETGININGKRKWLHNFSNDLWSWFECHDKRGSQAMNDIGILPRFSGVLCHDHWKPYYKYSCLHSLCNAHHLRELTRAFEQDKQQWAKDMKTLLLTINDMVEKYNGCLPAKSSKYWRSKYCEIIEAANKECPPPEKKDIKTKIKRSKARNLLERLNKFQDDVLRFMDNLIVPFTNNQGERDIRMMKVQQKISGCFRSTEGAKIFLIIRSYLSTCKKNDICLNEALRLLFDGQFPDFIQQKLDMLNDTS